MCDQAEKTVENLSTFICMYNTAFHFCMCNEEQKLVLPFMVNSLVPLNNLAFCGPKYSYLGLLLKQKILSQVQDICRVSHMFVLKNR